jgi:hypothetical protein
MHASEVELLSRESLDLILNTYLKAVHWYTKLIRYTCRMRTAKIHP